MYVLGINSVYHESSACLLKAGRIVAAAEEERFNRMKHGKQVRADNPEELPLHAIRYCLDAAGIGLENVEHIGCAGDPQVMERVRAEGLPSAWSSPAKQAQFLQHLPNILCKLEEMGFAGAFHWIGHHLAHAASTYYASSFSEAAVLAIDALGDDAYSAYSFHGVQHQLNGLKAVAYPSSLGYLWELHALFLGFDVYDAAKVMGLAAYGDPERYAAVLDRLVCKTPDGGFTTDDNIIRASSISYYPPSGYYEGLEALYGIRRREAGEALQDTHHDIAAALQMKTDEIVRYMVEEVHRATGAKSLCLAGGVALNCVTNRYVFEEGPFEHLYVQPASNDAGTALGAACYVWHHKLGHVDREPMSHAYLGPRFSSDEVEAVLRKQHLKYERVPDVERTVARLLSEGSIVGFFQGGMEFGPRALGNRSILADPRSADTRDLLNQKVKHREYFRPFAPSVLHEEAHRWFEIKKETPASDFMLVAYPAHRALRDQIPAVVHADGTCRVQTVKQSTNSRFHRLIAAFRELTGVPVVLNTSFNDQEPIICTPEDAIHTLLKTEIDYLAIEDWLVSKTANVTV